MKKVTVRRRKGYAHSLTARHHTLVSDEPEAEGGADAGPTPTELLALALGSCTAITVEMYANRKEWELGAVEVEVAYDTKAPGRARYEVRTRVPAELTEEQVERLEAIAGKCPVHRILLGEVEIADRVERVAPS